jgi:hypothetical protein
MSDYTDGDSGWRTQADSGGPLNPSTIAQGFVPQVGGSTASAQTVRRFAGKPPVYSKFDSSTSDLMTKGRSVKVRAYMDATSAHAAASTATLDEYNGEFWDRWKNPSFRAWLQSRAMAAQGLKTAPSTEDSYTFWVQYGEKAAAAVGWKGTPEQYLEFMANGGTLATAKQVEADMKAGKLLVDPVTGLPIDPATGLVEPDKGPVTSTSTSYDSISLSQAAAAADQALSAALGRNASASEKKLFRSKLQGALNKNPNVTKTVSDSNADGTSNTSVTHTKGGIDAGQVSSDIAESARFTAERKRFQAAGYLDRLISSVGPIV